MKKIPKSVTYAFYAWVASIALSLVQSVYQFTHKQEFFEYAKKSLGEHGANFTYQQYEEGVLTGLIIAGVFLVAYVALGWFTYKGNNVARNILTVLAALGIFNLFRILMSLGNPMPLWPCAVLSSIFGIATAVLLWTKDSKEYFDESKALKAEKKAAKLMKKYNK